MRLFAWIAGVLALAIAAFFLTGSDQLIRIAMGATSQTLCSKAFVSKLNPDEVYAQDMRPEGGFDAIDWALTYEVDGPSNKVRTSLFGILFQSVAIYHQGYGCVLLHDGYTQDLFRPPPAPVSALPLAPEIAGPDVVTPSDAGLTAALEHAFAEDADGPKRWTQAVVVVHDGKVIAERYAPGFGIDTPLLSHSVSKSVINALVGILVRDKKLTINGTVPFKSWHGEEGDPRAEVTIDQLLRMDSGLPVDEGGNTHLAQRMWFLERDSAAFAEKAPLAAAPGTAWAYSNLGYAILSRIVRDAIGGGPLEVATFAKRELFAPLGMHHAVMEFDVAGTPQGSNAMLATAREWAQFGLLYLNDGVVGGKRILPEGWAAYSAKQTLYTGYGAGFWINATDTAIPNWGAPWGMPGAPRDAYFARGYLGQYIVIVPSEKLVVVRFGASHAGMGDIEGVGALVHDVVAALHPKG